MKRVAKSSTGKRLLLVPNDWDGDLLAIGVVVSGGNAWEVPVGSALGRGYWEKDTGTFDLGNIDPIPWRFDQQIEDLEQLLREVQDA